MKKSIAISITVTAIFFLVYFLIVRMVYPVMIDRASFGDMFGGINAFFSGLAFLGVIYAVILQREELRLQRAELKLTREELKKSVAAQEKSEVALRQQVEAMQKTAKLNGLNSILQYYGSTLVAVTTGIHPNIDQRDLIMKDAEKIKKQIEDAIAAC